MISDLCKTGTSRQIRDVLKDITERQLAEMEYKYMSGKYYNHYNEKSGLCRVTI